MEARRSRPPDRIERLRFSFAEEGVVLHLIPSQDASRTARALNLVAARLSEPYCNANAHDDLAMGKFEVQRPGSETWTDAARFECFTCSASQLTKRVLAELPAALAVVDDPDAAVAAEPGPPESNDGGRPPDGPPRPQGKQPRLGALGKAGIGVLAVGVAGTAVGIGLVVSDGKQPEDDFQVSDRRTPGFVVIGVGAALALGGAAMLGVDLARSKKKRRAAALPVLGRRVVGIAVTVRF